MAEYIEREALFRSIADDVAPFNVAMVFRHIRNAPAADVAPVRHGRWETHYRSGTTVSEGAVSGCCDMWNGWKTPYCPNCGAKMDGKDGEAGV